MRPVLEIENLQVGFQDGTAAVRGVSLKVARGETHCLVGESGCGKSVTALSTMNLLARGAKRSADVMRFHDRDLTRLSDREMARLRGDKMAMIFQEPMTSLNPAYTIGSQMTEVFQRHRHATRAQGMDRAAELLERVGITTPDRRAGQLSPGEQQRVGIARALIGTPRLILADEPTASLDAANAAMIRDLLIDSASRLKATLIVVSHDEALLGRMARTLRLEKGRLA